MNQIITDTTTIEEIEATALPTETTASKVKSFLKKLGRVLAPFLIIGLATAYIPDWEKNAAVLGFLDIDLQEVVQLNIISYSYTYKKKPEIRYINYTVPVGLQETIGTDTLTVRFTKNELQNVSINDYDSQKYVWTVGYLDYLKKGEWLPLHDKFNTQDDFQVPFTIEQKDFSALDEKLYIELLPLGMRQDDEGNKMVAIDKWRISKTL